MTDPETIEVRLDKALSMHGPTASDHEWATLMAVAMDARDSLAERADLIASLRAERDVLRDALYFYADHDNWLQSMWLPTSPCLRDEGVVARAAIAAMKGARA